MRRVGFFLSLLFLAVACSKKNDMATQVFSQEHGVLVLCEGNFGWGEGQLHVLDTNTGRLRTNVFEFVNGIKLGNVVQSATQLPNDWLVVVNNSEKVLLLEKSTYRYLTTSSALTSPRYCVFDSLQNLIYVSDLYANGVHILQYPTLNKVGFIATKGWTEKLVLKNNRLYIASSSTDLSTDTSGKDKLLVYNTVQKAIIDSVRLGKGLQEIAVSPDGKHLACAYSKAYASGLPSVVIRDAFTLNTMNKITVASRPTDLHWLGQALFFLQAQGLFIWNVASNSSNIFTYPEIGNYTSLLPISASRVFIGNSYNYVTPARLYDCKIAGTSLVVDTSYLTSNIIGELYAF